jgi:hypothetical protein
MASSFVIAIYRNGVFVPTIPAAVKDPEEAARIRREVLERMKQNPIPADAPRSTREQLHERR